MINAQACLDYVLSEGGVIKVIFEGHRNRSSMILPREILQYDDRGYYLARSKIRIWEKAVTDLSLAEGNFTLKLDSDALHDAEQERLRITLNEVEALMN